MFSQLSQWRKSFVSHLYFACVFKVSAMDSTSRCMRGDCVAIRSGIYFTYIHSKKMKLSIAFVALTLGVSSAFTVPNKNFCRHDTSLGMSSNRREMISQVSSWALGGALMTAASQPASAAKRPSYLTEPTEEFKESERQRAEFRRAQIILKQRMQELLDKLSNESNDENALVEDLTALKALVAEIGGMPAGIKKDDLVKQVRAKKAKGFWPTPVEYAYQSLINEIMFQQSPNKDKDNMNPL